MCAAGTAAWSSRLWPCHRRACIQAQTPHWVPAFAGTTGWGTDQARWRLIRSSFRRTPESRSAPGYEPMCLPSKACGRAICGLATVKRAPKLKRCTGYRPAPVRRRGGTDQARWHLIRSSFRRRPESRSAPGYERTCAAGTAAWSSRLWPCHRRACTQTQTLHWVPACAGTTKLRRWRLSSAAAPARRAGRPVLMLGCCAGTTTWPRCHLAQSKRCLPGDGPEMTPPTTLAMCREYLHWHQPGRYAYLARHCCVATFLFRPVFCYVHHQSPEPVRMMQFLQQTPRPTRPQRHLAHCNIPFV